MRVILMILLTVASAFCSDAIPKRVQEIEKTFGAKYVSTVSIPMMDGKPEKYWEFVSPSNICFVKYVAFCVPVNATDAQVQYCIQSAACEAFFIDEVMKKVQELQHQQPI